MRFMRKATMEDITPLILQNHRTGNKNSSEYNGFELRSDSQKLAKTGKYWQKLAIDLSSRGSIINQ